MKRRFSVIPSLFGQRQIELRSWLPFVELLTILRKSI